MERELKERSESKGSLIKLNTERKGQNKRYHFVITDLIMQAGKSKLRISN